MIHPAIQHSRHYVKSDFPPVFSSAATHEPHDGPLRLAGRGAHFQLDLLLQGRRKGLVVSRRRVASFALQLRVNSARVVGPDVLVLRPFVGGTLLLRAAEFSRRKGRGFRGYFRIARTRGSTSRIERRRKGQQQNGYQRALAV